jgi:DNA transformation protein and related proteins
MALSQGFIETLTDQLAPLGHLTVRKMFGGAAVYCDGQIFALLSDDTLYLKVDDETRGAFEAEGCGPFVYSAKGAVQQVMTAYHRAPDRLLDDEDELRAWVRAAIAVGRRAAKPKPNTKLKSKSKPVTRSR